MLCRVVVLPCRYCPPHLALKTQGPLPRHMPSGGHLYALLLKQTLVLLRHTLLPLLQAFLTTLVVGRQMPLLQAV